MRPQLRDYQQDVCNRLRAAYKAKKRAPLVVLPTGAGKTVLFSEVACGAIERGSRVLVIAHRRELIRQIAMSLARFAVPHSIVGTDSLRRQIAIEQHEELGRSYVTKLANCMVGSVQTLSGRLDGLDGDPDLIIFDEAHHACEGTQWGKVAERFPKARFLFVTATPRRLDGRGLGVGCGGYADELIVGPSMRELIDRCYLSDYTIYSPSTIDVIGVRTRFGDFAKNELEERIDKPSITGDAVSHYRRYADGKRAVAFCVSIAHAEHVAEVFRAAGIPSQSVDGTLDGATRDARLRALGTGEIKVLTSAELIGEGLDIPAIECAILLRPTKSLTLYLQQVGRALRPAPGKSQAIVLDHVNACLSHGFPDDDRDWSLEGARANKAAGEADGPQITVCQECFANYRVGQPCPVCGTEQQPKPREVRVTPGELKAIEKEERRKLQAEAKAQREAEKAETKVRREAEKAEREQARLAVEAARTEEALLALGVGKPRAQHILAAREEKKALRAQVRNAMVEWSRHTGRSPLQVFGVQVSDIGEMKPKPLRELLERIESEKAAHGASRDTATA